MSLTREQTCAVSLLLVWHSPFPCARFASATRLCPRASRWTGGAGKGEEYDLIVGSKYWQDLDKQRLNFRLLSGLELLMFHHHIPRRAGSSAQQSIPAAAR